jgi:hypothetical protein
LTEQASIAVGREQAQRAFLNKYWDSLMAGDMAAFAPLVAEHCVVHYPGNHFLSGDHVGRKKVVDLYSMLYRIGIEQGTFVGELHDNMASEDHAAALIRYRIVLGGGLEIEGEAVGVFHIEDDQMVEYWLLERDQKMINDIFAMFGKASLKPGSSQKDLAVGALTHPFALARTLRRVIRARRGTTTKML